MIGALPEIVDNVLVFRFLAEITKEVALIGVLVLLEVVLMLLC